MSVLVVGCGYLGLRAVKLWRAAGREVFALTRSRADALRAEGVTPVVGDVTDPDSLQNLPHTTTVLYAVGMDRSSGRTMREVYVQGLRNVIRALTPPTSSPSPPGPLSLKGRGGVQNATPSAPSASVQEPIRDEHPLSPVRERGPGGEGTPKFLYVSSTGVYGQTDGSWVDEASPTLPLEESGRVVLDAEAALRELRPEAITLRFAGLYGPGRVLRRAALLNREPVPGDGEKFVNLIHADDGARAVLLAEERGTPGETYLIADTAPPTRRELFTLTAELLGAPVPVFVGGNGVEANRRVSSAKARERLGFTPAYPTIREGLPGSV